MRFLFYVFFFLINTSFAQDSFKPDSIDQKMFWLNKGKSKARLFVHFDKNVYSNNETVYFTGYLLNIDSNATKEHRVMSVALVRNADSSVISQGKFLMQDGLSYGNLLIIDKVIPGDHHFVAYTDRMINAEPEVIFSQAITIKTASDPPFKASMKLLEEKKITNSEKRILINVASSEGSFLKTPPTINYKYDGRNKSLIADNAGQTILSLPTNTGIKDPNLYLKIKNGRDSNFISMPIPQPKGNASVGFYPEGGSLILGISSTVAIEVKDPQKAPMLLKAVLYKNDEVINTIETSNYGIGKFKLLPEENSSYKIKLIHSSLRDSVYLLPKPKPTGLAVSINEAIVEDTLRATLRTNRPGKIIIRIHNFQSSYIITSFELKTTIQAIKIPLDEVPKGLTTLTITDSLHRPLAERMFFAHYSSTNQLNIYTNKQTYTQREKVKVRVSLNKPNDNAILSVAAVQDNRLSPKNLQDISSFIYLNDELKQLPQNLNGNALVDKNYLEEILLVKGWRRYTWQDLENASNKVVEIKADSLKFSGRLTYKKKQVTIDKVITYGGPNPYIVPLDSAGYFSIPSSQMIEKPGTKLFFLLNGPDRAKVNFDYQIKVNDPYLALNASLAKRYNPDAPILPSSLPNNNMLVLKNNERAIQLKEVVIGNKNGNIIGNACGDYICPYNILNCINHAGHGGNTLPKIGRRYLAYSGQPETLEYKGCFEPNESVFFRANPVYLHKEFYINDYKDPLEPAYFSTIYWNYGLILNGEKELEFYTSDITGKFRIVFQGISSSDLVYAEQSFEVKPKQNP
ncbi:MAG: hypothetical protein EOO87_09550 [Pedobacter sp.]|nr:MAG: hypothetical protein EOO87_09550 [Pedobacter sp.]